MIFLDSNIWIFSEMRDYPEHDLAKKKLAEYINDGVVINDIILSETFYKIYRLISCEEAVMRTSNIINSANVAYMPIEKETIQRALELSKLIRINDAIIAQHVIDSKSALLTDNVKDFRKIKGLKIIKLR